MKIRYFQCCLLLSLAFACADAYAQGFPWDDFKPRTLKEIVGMEADVDRRDQKENNVVFHGDMLLSRVRVIYGARSRPVSEVKKEMIRNWTKVMGNPDSYAEAYQSDFLFTEDSVDYWLPVQKKVSAYFDKELKAGDAVDLYLVRAGGVRTAGKWDWLLLVEEFQKPKDDAQSRPAEAAKADSMKDAANSKYAVNSKYKAGQVWSYRTRPGEEQSYIVVVKVEGDQKLGNIVHVAVRNLRMKNPHTPDGFSDEVGHLPFAEEAIDRSVVKLLKENVALPDYEQGYRMWREAFDAGRAGIYTITLAEAVKAMELMLSQ